MDLTDDFASITNDFVVWLSEVGIEMNPKIALADFRSEGRGRGVVALDALPEDEVIFSIPRSAILNIENARDSIPHELGTDEAVPGWLALTAIILTEIQRTQSKWKPYFAVLPNELDSLVFWSDSELAELQASSVVHKIGKNDAEELFLRYLSPLGLHNTNHQTFHKVASTIMAYAFDVPEEINTHEGHDIGNNGEDDLVSDDEDDERALLSMIPLADMLNADADRNNARLCCDNERLEMRTTKIVLAGQELLNDYGSLPRSDLARRYGYVTDNYAQFDVVELSTKSIIETLSACHLNETVGLVPLSLAEIASRIDLAEREGIYDETYDISHPGSNGPCVPDELVALVYMMLLDSEHITLISKSTNSLPERAKLATQLTGEVLSVLLRFREQEYLTSLEEDERLQLENMSKRNRMALQIRLGEKRVLRLAAQEASTMSGSNDRMRILNKHTQDSDLSSGKGKRKLEEGSNHVQKRRH